MGTKLTFIAPVFALTAGVIAIAPRGARIAQGSIWAVAMLATGGYWYARNLIAAGNPLPWVDLGPLPNPERLVEGRPDFSVSHYLTDGDVWRDFFLPGLDVAFGDLWWVMLAFAFAGMVFALLRAGDPVRRMLGAAALFAAIAYLFTPLTASGYEGEPLGFVLNLRYLAPALAIGLALAPTLIPGSGRWPWFALAILAALFAITDEPYRIWRDTYRDGAVVVGLATLAIGAMLYALYARRVPAVVVVVTLTALAAAGVAAFHPQQRDYIESRYVNAYTKFHLDSAIRWAREQTDARIGIVGTTAAFFQFGFYGTDLSNEVRYVGQRGPHGAFAPIQSCKEWRRALNEGDYDYVVTTPTFNQQVVLKPRFSPEGKWTRGDPAVREVPEAHERRVSVYRISGRLDPAGCDRIKRPFSGLAPQLLRGR